MSGEHMSDPGWEAFVQLVHANALVEPIACTLGNLHAADLAIACQVSPDSETANPRGSV